mgnify:FL=1
MSYQQNSLMHLENQEHLIKKSRDLYQILLLKNLHLHLSHLRQLLSLYFQLLDTASQR